MRQSESASTTHQDRLTSDSGLLKKLNFIKRQIPASEKVENGTYERWVVEGGGSLGKRTFAITPNCP
jgi:hypothetical protein